MVRVILFICITFVCHSLIAEEKPADVLKELRVLSEKLTGEQNKADKKHVLYNNRSSSLRRQLRELGSTNRELVKKYNSLNNDNRLLLNMINDLKSEILLEEASLSALEREFRQISAAEIKDLNTEAGSHREKLAGELNEWSSVNIAPGKAYSEENGRLIEGTEIRVGNSSTLFLSNDKQQGGVIYKEMLLDLGRDNTFQLQKLLEEGEGKVLVASGHPEPVITEKPVEEKADVPVPSEPVIEKNEEPEPEKDWISEIYSGGWVMVPLFLLGIVGVLVALWRFFDLRSMRYDGDSQLVQLENRLAEESPQKVEEVINKSHGPVKQLMKRIYPHYGLSLKQQEEILYEELLGQLPRLDRGLQVIAVAAAAAPLLGLLGTVAGIINTFKEMGAGGGHSDLFAAGIAQALVTTKYGLITAIICMALHSLLSRRIRKLGASLEKACMSYLNAVSIRKG